MNTVWMNQLSWVDYEARLKNDQPPIFLPVGALEQHGPHLPPGTDGLLSAAVAASTAELINGLVAPTLSYGYKSQPKCGGGQHFCGTTSVDAATLIGSVRDAVREFGRHGAKHLVICNGHYENQWFLIEGIDLGLRDFLELSGYAAMAGADVFRLRQTIDPVRAATDHGSHCITAGDACAASEPQLQQPALDTLGVVGGIFGGVSSSAQLISRFNATLQAAP